MEWDEKKKTKKEKAKENWLRRKLFDQKNYVRLCVFVRVSKCTRYVCKNNSRMLRIHDKNV